MYCLFLITPPHSCLNYELLTDLTASESGATQFKPTFETMQLPTPASSAPRESPMPPPPRPKVDQKQSQPDMFLELIDGQVITVVVGSGTHALTYHLPIKLLCSQSHFFRSGILHYETVQAWLDSNKKRKLSVEDEQEVTEIKKEDDESDVQRIKMHESNAQEMTMRLADVDPVIFGLFLRFIYTGFYPATVDALPEAIRSGPYTTKSTQHILTKTPARGAVPPPANNSLSQPPPAAQTLPPTTSPPETHSPSTSSKPRPIPPSVHAYLLSIRLGAPGFMNQALNHIYYGMGKSFALTPSLIDYIWTHTSPTDRLLGPSPLRRLILDVLIVHWASSTTQIIAKHPALASVWNDVLDTHRELRHAFTMGLQGSKRVLVVEAYFVSTALLGVPVEDGREVSGCWW
ncbi:hypothetical protein EJ07DRAFT_171308 [Lizonia empirigonia]|nr:hypothetical protein EJ07DRAFT_171308 [Lizonia empirigonia]